MRPWQLSSNDLERYTTRRVLFTQPRGTAPAAYPAGVYRVKTKEHPLDDGRHTAHVRTSTVLTIPTGSGTYCREVRGRDLDESILRNRQRAGSRDPGKNPDCGDAEGNWVLS